MKKFFLIIAISFIAWNFSSVRAESTPTDTLNIASFNVRIAVDAGNRAWANRKEHVADIIKNLYAFDIFGVQELRNTDQESELMEYLGGYRRFSKGRDNNAGTSGERLAIVYKSDRFEQLNSGFFFLSETPDVASLGWDAKFNRICIWTKMKDKYTSQEFYFFCAHYDHVGVEARRESSKLIISKMTEIMGNEDLPVFFVGDFNSQPDNPPYMNIIKGGLLDSRTIPVNANVFGPVGTTNGWNKNPSEMTNRIDYIFVNPKVEVYSYYTITKKYFPDAYPSDHCPIMIKALINNQTLGLKH